jgi:outer membrane lipoprotein-sorting protein
MDRMAERDLIINGYDVWLWDSQENTATHVAVPPHDKGDFPKPGDTPTPAELAEKFLEAVDPTTEVTVDDDTEVAGRTAYDLVLTPRSTEDTLVGSVRVAVDSETGLPLRVQITARDETEPAFLLEFTELSLETPDADIFEFEPPPGATVKEKELPAHPSKDGKTDGDHGDFPGEVSGSGWDTVIELPAGSAPAELTESPMFAQATEAVDEGAVLSTTLLNILITDDGRVYVGSVPVERLQSAAAGG